METVIKIGVIAVLILVLAIAFVGCEMVGPGYAGIKVNYYGSQRGVEDFPLTTGMVLYFRPTSTVYKYPTFVQTAVWTQDSNEGSPNNEEMTCNTKEGLVIRGDISLSYQLDRERVPYFYVKFRSDDLRIFTHGFMRNIARDAFNETAVKYTVEEIYGHKKEEFINEVKKRINTQINPYGVNIEQFGFIGALRIPENVVEALNAKIKATQDAIRAENELRQAKAEAQKRIAAAEGEARSNTILTKSISPPLLRWRQLEIIQEAVKKWDGRRPMVEGSNSGLLLQIPIPAENK